MAWWVRIWGGGDGGGKLVRNLSNFYEKDEMNVGCDGLMRCDVEPTLFIFFIGALRYHVPRYDAIATPLTPLVGCIFYFSGGNS